MGTPGVRRTQEQLKNQIILASARSFLERGYTESTLRGIADAARVNIGSLINIFGTKEEILCEILGFVIEKQFSATAELLRGVTDDKLFIYAAETVLQLHIVEMNENLRDVYSMAYSLPKSSRIIQHQITEKLEVIFKDYLPDYETKDFYKLEIATGGIMRGFMTIPCDMWFTMDQKVRSFLETTLLIYQVPKEKIADTIAFVEQFDFAKIANDTIDAIVEAFIKD